jgi:hypothetical protein
VQASAIAERAGERLVWFGARSAGVTALVSLGRLGAAMAQARETEEVARAGGLAGPRVHALIGMGLVEHHLGDAARARDLGTQALALAGEQGMAIEEWDALDLLLDVEIAAGALPRAGSLLAAAWEKVTHAYQERELRLKGRLLDHLEHGAGSISPADLAMLEQLGAEGTPDVRTRVHVLLGQIREGADAYPHVLAAYDALALSGDRETFWRVCWRRGAIEAALGLPGARDRVEEAARVVLGIAVDLSPEMREIYLESHGRPELLEAALGARG